MFNKIIKILIFLSISYTMTLQEAFNNAVSYENYDKYLLLDPNTIYTGGLGIYEGDIYINCQGATIDLQEGNGIWIYGDVEYPSSLHIEYCTITNGSYYGLSFGGLAVGNIINCNLINTNFGLKLFDVSEVFVTNSIFANNLTYGIGVYGDDTTLETSYSLLWDNLEADCMENCPGWGNIWTPLELSPGAGIIYQDPQFINVEQFNFNLLETSPCINSGNPQQNLDYDGSISDIGANPFINESCNNSGDLNNDGNTNVLDIVELVNCILFNNECTLCFDINNDQEYNILDILNIVNIIIE